MVRATEWSAADIQYLKDHYWEETYDEIAGALGMSPSVVHRKAKNDLELPKKTDRNRIEYTHGVPLARVLYHLHHDAKLSVNKMSGVLNVSRKTLDRWFEDTNIYKRGQSEAEVLKHQQMSEEERRELTRPAREAQREKYGDGGYISAWVDANPEAAREVAQKAAPLGTPAREKNGMAGVTGQDHPNWRGGKSIYDAVKKQLPGPSWSTHRARHRADECRMCGASEAKLDLHHIVPVLAGGMNERWNFMTLCTSCHHKAEWYTRDLLPPVLTD